MTSQRAASGNAAAGRRAVAIGGGHGLARALRALPRLVSEVTAVVTVADDGGSSGRLRRDLDVLPPGDLRMALTALARDEELSRLVDFRFDRGELAGHSLGNLMLVAMEELADGDVVAALDQLAYLLKAPGRVLPCTLEPVTLHAATTSGEVAGQAAVTATPRLERVWLEPGRPRAQPEAITAIRDADMVVLGPGSLYTSLLPNLLVPEVAEAVADAEAPVVLVANLREQPGETEGMDLRDHLRALADHVPTLHLDVLVVHDGPAPKGAGAPLRADRQLAEWVGRVVTADLVDGADGHDPLALARALSPVLHGS